MIRISRTLLVILFLCGMLLLPAIGSAQSNVQTQDHLMQIARIALSVQLDNLTATSHADSLDVDPSVYGVAIQDQVVDARGKRAFLMQRGFWYSGYTTNLQFAKMEDEDSGSVTIHAIEHTALQIATDINDPLAPKTYEYELPHNFLFALQKNQWVLVSDETAPFGFATDTDGSSRKETMPADNNVADSVLPGVVNINRSAVVNYAYQYWQNYNTSVYPRSFGGYGQGGDCTNFVSQAMRAGGWSPTGGWDWRSPSEWWYGALTQTYTWVNVNNFYSFMRYTNRGNTVLTFVANFSPVGSFFNPLATGDLLQFDATPTNGSYDHNMIITSKDSRGYIYLTYHTTNTRDRPIWDLIYATPNYSYRGIRIY
ncbi:MAG: amidase domain-containing protein [Anaerolineae bacterium]